VRRARDRSMTCDHGDDNRRASKITIAFPNTRRAQERELFMWSKTLPDFECVLPKSELLLKRWQTELENASGVGSTCTFLVTLLAASGSRRPGLTFRHPSHRQGSASFQLVTVPQGSKVTSKDACATHRRATARNGLGQQTPEFRGMLPISEVRGKRAPATAVVARHNHHG